MNRVVRVKATDERIMYNGAWQGDKTTMRTTSSDSFIFFIFRGTGIKVWGGATSPLTLGAVILRVDPNGTADAGTSVRVNGSISGTGISPIYHADNMEDGDHQLEVFVDISGQFFEIGSFDIENSSGDGFDLLGAGPTAQNVPAQAITVDNFNPEITYHDESSWIHDSRDISCYDSSNSYTWTLGDSLSYSFNGVAIWYYGTVNLDRGFFNVSIDGSTPQRLNAESNAYLRQQLIWSNVSLGPGRHNLTITHDDPRTFRQLSLDFFRVLPDPVFSTTSLELLPTDVKPVAPANQSQTNRVPLAVGLTLGLLALVVGALGSFCYQYRRRGRVPGAPPVSPYAVPPIRQADLQSRLPQGGKRAPQLAPPSGTPVDPGSLPTQPYRAELGPPPSYESQNA